MGLSDIKVATVGQVEVGHAGGILRALHPGDGHLTIVGPGSLI